MTDFSPWQRKTGLVTLLLACVLMMGWIRSNRIADKLLIRSNERTLHLLVSANGWIGWIRQRGQVRTRHRTRAALPQNSIEFPPDVAVISGPQNIFWWSGEERRTYTPFHNVIELDSTGQVYSSNIPHLILPYYLVVPFLAALSAYLLLRKPRGTHPHPNQKSNHDDRTPIVATPLERGDAAVGRCVAAHHSINWFNCVETLLWANHCR